MSVHFSFTATGALATASALPRLPSVYVPRPSLSEKLLRSDSRLRLLSAPAGFGKSVLLNECARQVPSGTALLWLDMQGRAWTLAQFISTLATALAIPSAEVSDVEGLLSYLARIETPVWIMLDDYPRQVDCSLDACINSLLERAPSSLVLWVSARVQPSWNLPRLLLQGDLYELDAQALALTEDELQRLLHSHRLDVSHALRDELMSQTEGWMAAVCLLLLHADPGSLAERLRAGTPVLRDYVQREVLSGLPEDLVYALFSLVHLPRFCAELCEHILEGGRRDVLAQLRVRQLFIRPLDSCGQWYRFWRPLSLILPRLPQALPATQVFIRACQWSANHGQMREAVEYSLLAGQPEVAANFLLRFDQEQLLVGHSVAQFLRWRSELPSELFSSSARLIALHAWALIISARLDEAQSCIEGLARFLPQPSAEQQASLLAHWQSLMGALQRQQSLPSARQHCLEALQYLPMKAWSQRILCHHTLAQQALAQGELGEADLQISEALRLSRLNGSVLYEGLINLERVHQLDLSGDLDRALEQCELSLLHLQGQVQHSPVLARTQLIRGYLLSRQGRDVEARKQYQQGLLEAQNSEDAHTIFGYLGLAGLAVREGNSSLALQRLNEAERVMQWRHVPEVRYQSMLSLIRSSVLLWQGQPLKAKEILDPLLKYHAEHGLLSPSGAYELLLRLRRLRALVELQLGNAMQALNRLSVLVDECEQLGLKGMACECRLSLAETLYVLGESQQALLMLRHGYDEALAMRLMRPLVELQQKRLAWVQKALPELRLMPKAEEVGRAVIKKPEGSWTRVEELTESPLSSREVAVLRLIAQGLSNQEIAQQLFISLHTVKTHARRINTKLGVARRTQAVAKAKGLGVLG